VPNRLHVSDLRIHRAPDQERRQGLLAWVSFQVDGWVMDRFAIRRTMDGRPYLSFPKHKDNQGELHPVAWLPDHRDRQSIQAQILAMVDFEELAR